MHKKEKFVKNQFTWPICKKLLFLILEDKVSDVFVCELVWERLFYTKELSINDWAFSALTPSYWSEKFEKAPQIISERPASVHLTRSIPKEYGGFGGDIDIIKSRIIASEFASNRIPPPMGGQGIDMLVPTLLELGTEEQKQQYIKPTLHGEMIW